MTYFIPRLFVLSPILSLALAASGAAADPAGYKAFTIYAPHHQRDMEGAVWYPTDGEGRSAVFAENPIFYGVDIVEDAPVLEGLHPVVVLSHGMGGTVRSLAWLASGLAEQGAVVISVNHPNSTWGDFDLAANLHHWTRVQDLSLALDTVMADPEFAGHLDTSRVMVAGFSYGGWTALSMGGLRGNRAGYIAHCDSYGAASVHCGDVQAAGLDLTDVDETAWNASYADPRITHVSAIDPGLVWGVDSADVAGLSEHTRLIGLGAGAARLLATDFDTSGFAALLPDARIGRIVPATHFSALPLCKPMGAAILAEEQDDPVCTDPDGTDRAQVHAEIIDHIWADLSR